MKNGGVDLWEYGQKENVTPQFWAEFHRCIKGVERFLNGGYVHYDIKPDNIVYDETENRVNFIDFGLMRKKRDIFEKGVVDGIRVTYHTTYSLEHFFYNKTNYERVLLGSHEDKKRFITNFRNLIVNDGGSDPLLQSIHKSIVGLFRWIGGKKEWWDRILKDYEEFIMLEREPGHFREFVASALNKFDIYGLGLTVVYMLRCCRDTVTPAFSDEMYELAYQMITPNIYSRVNVVTLSVKYTEIVRRHYGTSIANIGAVLNSHTPFNAGKKMGGGGGGGKTPLNVIMDGKNTQFFEKLTVKRRAQIPQHVTMKKNPHFVIANLQTHINVSKKRRNKYRFMKNKKRRNPPTLKGM
jgi:serine/threonine protein kinase